MAIDIIKKAAQAYGEFNGGEIVENKPLGFPQDGGSNKPYSNLFYWANAWTDIGSTIGLHPHQGFEIMSFVIKGSIEHYDTKNDNWRELTAGDVQIIRSGSGISHSEKLNKEAQMFQIWFDPDLKKTMSKPPSYNDYKSSGFNVEQKGGIEYKHYVGNGSPITMDTPGLRIYELSIDAGVHRVEISKDNYYSMYLISGKLSIDGNNIEQDDFAVVKDQDSMEIIRKETSRLFVIESPAVLEYKTYSELVGIR